VSSIRKKFSLKGRVSRKEYLIEYLLKPIFLIVAIMIIGLLAIGFLNEFGNKVIGDILTFFILITSTILLYVSIALIIIGAVKRSHDIDFSGRWGLLTSVPFLVAVYIQPELLKLILFFNPLFTSFFTILFLIGSIPALLTKGKVGSNQYGKDPLEQ